jgi:hypothetical protein
MIGERGNRGEVANVEREDGLHEERDRRKAWREGGYEKGRRLVNQGLGKRTGQSIHRVEESHKFNL